MQILFLGTGSGKTSLHRNHSSILMNDEEFNLLIDCGDGTAKSLLQNKIPFTKINALIITHLHADHYSGVASLVTQMKLGKRKKPFTIYVNQNQVKTVAEFINSTYMFIETIGFELAVKGFQHDSPIRLNRNFSLTAKQNSHTIQKPELKNYSSSLFVSSSLMIHYNDCNIFYTSDVGSASDLYLFDQKNISFMITECSHLSLDEIHEAFKKQRPEKLLITHIDDEIEQKLIEWHSNLKPDEKARVILCYDGLSFNTVQTFH